MGEYKAIVLGAGISGISCAIYLKRAGISTLVIENNVPGGQLNKASLIENYPGYSSISGPDLVNHLMEQFEQHDIPLVYDEVIEVDFNHKLVKMKDNEYSYQYLVFATGRRERTLKLEHEEDYIGRGISFCATCDGALYKNQDVVVVGGGSSAVSEAIYLSSLCHKVYLVYRGEHLRAEEVLKDRLQQNSNVEVIYHDVVSKYKISDGKICGVFLKSGVEIDANCVFLAVGHIPNSELFDGNKKDGYIVVNSFGETSLPFVYACGDVVYKQVYQLITASSEGAVVATSIIKNS